MKIDIAKTWFIPLFLLGLSLVPMSGCKEEESEKPATISDDNFYKMIGSAMVNCFTDIYNQNLAGAPTGNQNITAAGPMGGTVIITGSDSWDDTHDIMTTDLLFSMAQVKYIFSASDSGGNPWNAEVTLTGDITYTGSWGDDFTSVNHQSSNLHIKGSATYLGATRNLDSSGEVYINRSSVISVNIFGNIVTW